MDSWVSCIGVIYRDTGQEHGNYNRCVGFRAYLWLAGNEGMEKNMEISIMGYVRDCCKDPFLPS